MIRFLLPSITSALYWFSFVCSSSLLDQIRSDLSTLHSFKCQAGKSSSLFEKFREILSFRLENVRRVRHLRRPTTQLLIDRVRLEKRNVQNVRQVEKNIDAKANRRKSQSICFSRSNFSFFFSSVLDIRRKAANHVDHHDQSLQHVKMRLRRFLLSLR